MAKHVFLAAEGELPANNAGSAVVGPAPVQPPYAHLHPQVELVTPPTPDRLLPGQPLIPPLVEEQAGYRLRFARTEADLEEVQRLRFRVFNLELNEGLAESYQTGRDEDAFDAQCQHLMVEHAPSGGCVGTYRLQVAESALGGLGFYSAGEFELGQLPDEVLARSVELGRACVELEHRSKRVLFLLWRGLAEYVSHNERDRFFGCSSLTSQDPAEGVRLYRQLGAKGMVHPTLRVEPVPECACPVVDPEGPTVSIPTLFGIYLRHGAHVLGPPAIDRQFGTIDFLTYLEVRPEHIETFGKRKRRAK